MRAGIARQPHRPNIAETEPPAVPRVLPRETCMPHDALVLRLLGADIRLFVRSLRRRDLAWIVLGGGGLLAYGWLSLTAHAAALAPHLRAHLPVAVTATVLLLLLLGAGAGAFLQRVAIARGRAAWLTILPLSDSALSRSIRLGALALAAVAATATGAAVGALALTLGLGWVAAPTGITATAVFLLDAALVISAPHQPEPSRLQAATARGLRIPGLAAIDRIGLPWFAAWSWGTQPGRIRVTARRILSLLALTLLAYFMLAAGLMRHDATPGLLAGLAGGVLIFVLSLRCAPLASPVLRTAPIGFLRAWLRLLRLPLLLSLAFFAVPAGTAFAASPHAWAIVPESGLGLLALNAIYAVFAAYFLRSTFLAAVAFLAALTYFVWGAAEYGQTVYLGLAALVGWLWYRARRRYRHG